VVDDLARDLASGVAALRKGDFVAAVDPLRAVATHADLAQTEDLRDIWARANSLYAQALLGAGRPGEARVPLRRALDALSALGDAEGVAEVEALQAQVGTAMADLFQAQARRRSARRLADQPWEQLVDGVTDPERRASLLLERASAALDLGRAVEARSIADVALDVARAAQDVRHTVMAHLALARTFSADDPASTVAHLELARAEADHADETALVGIAAKAAAELGFPFSPLEGP
jgi:tetratricopeptide (TPR) repeat protein